MVGASPTVCSPRFKRGNAKEKGNMTTTTLANAFVRGNVKVNGVMPGKPVIPPLKEKNGKNGADPAYYIVYRLNGPCERFVKGESARKAYKVLGGVRLVRVNRDGGEVEL